MQRIDPEKFVIVNVMILDDPVASRYVFRRSYTAEHAARFLVESREHRKTKPHEHFTLAFAQRREGTPSPATLLDGDLVRVVVVPKAEE